MLTLSPMQQQCFYNIQVSPLDYKLDENSQPPNGGSYEEIQNYLNKPHYHAQGQINVEQCKSKTFVIK